MAFTYTHTPGTSVLDAIRVELGDTHEHQHELDDEEILYAYSKEGSVNRAAARCCEMLAARYAKKEGFRGGSVQSEKRHISTKYHEMAKMFRMRGTTGGSFSYPSALKSTKDASRLDTDVVQPSFSRGKFKHPDASEDDLTPLGN